MEERGSRSGEAEGGSLDSLSAWNPCGGAFRPYLGTQSSGRRPPVARKRTMVVKLTRDIVATYQLCDPGFKCAETLNLKHFFTSPSVAVQNDGFDNTNSDMILYTNFVLVNFETRQRYIVKDMLGQGTFGQVVKCWVPETDHFVAVKVIKNQPAYYRQGMAEVSILSLLNNNFDLDDKRHIVRMLDYFIFRNHLCIAFEMLGPNLFELIKLNNYKGLSLNIVQMFSKQILHALVVIKDAGIIHCDLKPENILISTSLKPAEIKVIDFGSACMEKQTIYSYIQSRYYRSPEVLLGCSYTTAIDMWSFGCIVAELFLGLPLFPGASEFDILRRMIDTLSGQPPDELLRLGSNTNKFFKRVGSIYSMENDAMCKRSLNTYQFLTEEEYEARESRKPVIGKQYYNFVKLEDIIANYPYKKNLPEEEISRENRTRLALVDFLRGLVQFDPEKRWSPLQASLHPFVTGEPFLCPYRPPQEVPQIPVIHTVAVSHNPVEGHWLAAGLSPQVLNVHRYLPHNSPHMQTPLSYGSYGSMGSYGSYSDNTGFRNSYGSYGDFNSMYAYQPPVGSSAMSIQGQFVGSFLGASPDARRRPPLSHGNGFGISPNAGNFTPMSLGVSPSQYTPPSSQIQIAIVPPGKFGPTSARVTLHGSPLGKGAAVGQFKKSWGSPGTSHMQLRENSSQSWHNHHSDYGYPDVYARGVASSPHSAHATSNFSSWRLQKKCGNTLFSGSSSSTYQKFSVCHPPSQTSELTCDEPESSSLPDPADWDPNYSDELLLQENTHEVNSISFGIAKDMHLNDTVDPASRSSGASRSSVCYNQVPFISSNPRTEGRFPAHPPLVGNPPSTSDIHTSYDRLPPFPQNSPSRFGQQSAHRYMQSTFTHSNPRDHQQQSRSNYSRGDSYSSASSLLGNGISLGRRAGHPVATTLPSSHA